MNKFTLALVLGTGLTASLASPVPQARASSIQTISTPTLSASTFNQDFTPFNAAVLSPFRFAGATSDSGLIESQVFQGQGKYAGTYAYAYQVQANPSDGSSQPLHVDSTSFLFNATPIGSDLTGAGKSSYGYVITNGQVGGLNLAGSQAPTNLSWQPDQTTGVIRAQYVDAAGQLPPLSAGSTSATFVLLSTQMPSNVKPSVNVGGAAATTTVPVAYSTTAGTIEPIPVPEPATFIAWAGMIGGAAMVRRIRRSRRTAV